MLATLRFFFISLENFERLIYTYEFLFYMGQYLLELINAAPKPELVELSNGFFALDETKTGNLEAKELLLMIHAYRPGQYEDDIRSPYYTAKRDALIKSCQETILVGIEDKLLPITVEWLKRLEPKGARVIYLTGLSEAAPKKPLEDEFVEKIRDTFHPSLIKLFGAELHLNTKGELVERGCVNYTFRLLSGHFDVEILRDCCWKWYSL